MTRLVTTCLLISFLAAALGCGDSAPQPKTGPKSNDKAPPAEVTPPPPPPK